jgi:hypothetical protein
MIDSLRKTMIDYLIADKFPAKVPIGKVLKNQEDVGQFVQALALRAELDALDDEGLKSRYDAVAVPKAKATEDARPFNQPYAKADFGHWAKLAYWKVDEGIALLLGRSPQFLVWESVKDVRSPLVWQFGRIREVAVRAVHYKQINDPGYPGAFVTWAKRFDFAVPAELEEKVAAFGHYMGDWYGLYEASQANYAALSEQSQANYAALSEQSQANNEQLKALVEKWQKMHSELSASSSKQFQQALAGLREKNDAIRALQTEVERLRKEVASAPIADKPLGPREGDSLRKLVIGMAIKGYSLDPGAGRSKVVAEIVSDLLELGLELSDDTVRRHLKEAADLLPPPSAPERQRAR